MCMSTSSSKSINNFKNSHTLRDITFLKRTSKINLQTKAEKKL